MAKIEISKSWDGKETFNPVHLNVSYESSTNSLILDILAPYYNDAKSKLFPAGRCPELWNYEVVELFISSCERSNLKKCPYFEIVVGPHNHYIILQHTGEANFFESKDDILLSNPPDIKINHENSTWSANIMIPLSLLPEPILISENRQTEPVIQNDTYLQWYFNAFAIFGEDPHRNYLSFNAVPGERPNYHQLAYFTPLCLPRS